MNEPEFKQWYVTECSTPDCWCRRIGTKPNSDDMEDCIVPAGSIHQDYAEQVVAEHNERPGLLKTINDLRRELAEAKGRITVLEKELDQAATALQKTHPIGEVKGIGLREVGLATEQVCELFAAARAEAVRLREALSRVCGALVEASTMMQGFDPTTMTTALLRYMAENCKWTAEHYSRLALAAPAADASGEVRP